MTRIRITHPDVIHDVGDEVDVDDARAERLVSIGYADYADGRDDPRLRTDDTDDHDQPQADEGDDTPNKSATKAEWVDYAVAQGWTQDDAEAATKAELVDALGGGE
jgi:hypothetical protein